MNKYPLIGGSCLAVVLLVLGSLTNVIGYQTVQSSNQKAISNEVDQKELLFQTILDIANNKEIQRIILKSQLSREGFLNSDMKFSVLNTPILTKNQLKHMYLIGLILSKSISKSKIHSMVERYQVNNQEMQKEINTVIEKNAKLKGELTQLSNLNCDCEENNAQGIFRTIICSITELVFYGAVLIYQFTISIPLLIISLCLFIIGETSLIVGSILTCDWMYPEPPHDMIRQKMRL